MKEAHKLATQLLQQGEKSAEALNNEMNRLDSVLGMLDKRMDEATPEQRKKFEEVKMMTRQTLDAGKSLDKSQIENIMNKVNSMRGGGNN
jgi:malonyl CoA-acyl carrier protein transacylase